MKTRFTGIDVNFLQKKSTAMRFHTRLTTHNYSTHKHKTSSQTIGALDFTKLAANDAYCVDKYFNKLNGNTTNNQWDVL